MKRAAAGMLLLGLAAGYLAARVLLERDPLLDEAPAAARDRLASARDGLLRARSAAMLALLEMRRTSDEAERELTAEYHHRTGRSERDAPPA